MITLLWIIFYSQSLFAAPSANQLTSPTTVISYCHEQKIQSYSELSESFGGLTIDNYILYARNKLIDIFDPDESHFKKKNYFKGTQVKGREFRYLYSPKWGWLDMSHFTSAAMIVSNPGISEKRTLRTMEASEREEQKQTVALSYEDSVSNMLGVYFHRYVKAKRNNNSDPQPSEGFCNHLDLFLKELGYRDEHQSKAPNLENLSEMPVDQKLYEPAFTLPHLESDSRVDQEIRDWFIELEL